jgi:hypothetical protein
MARGHRPLRPTPTPLFSPILLSLVQVPTPLSPLPCSPALPLTSFSNLPPPFPPLLSSPLRCGAKRPLYPRRFCLPRSKHNSASPSCRFALTCLSIASSLAPLLSFHLQLLVLSYNGMWPNHVSMHVSGAICSIVMSIKPVPKVHT